MADKVKLSKDGSSIDFVQTENIPTSVKKFRRSPEIEGFYRFIFENDLQKEVFTILERIIGVRKAKKKTDKVEAAALAQAVKKSEIAAAKAETSKPDDVAQTTSVKTAVAVKSVVKKEIAPTKTAASKPASIKSAPTKSASKKASVKNPISIKAAAKPATKSAVAKPASAKPVSKKAPVKKAAPANKKPTKKR